jgi:hypothetical protein
MNEPQVTQSHGAFSLTCTVEVTIQAQAARISGRSSNATPTT